MPRVAFRTLLAAALATLAGCAGGWRNGAPPWEQATATVPTTAAAGVASNVTADGVKFVYQGEAKSVALAGEFNSWNMTADPLTRQTDGTWSITKQLPPGKYPYKFVIDGGTWKADDNAKETVDDGYGGKNSVVVVGAGAASGAAATAPAAAAAPVALTGVAKPPAQGPDGVTFTYAGPASSVGLAGDFNAWSITADPMKQQADGTWSLTKKLAAGAHPYKFIVNGANWKTDTANPDAQDDGFGGKNSIVTVK